MNRWFYAVLFEPAALYSTAIKATSLEGARARLARMYPHATVVEIERGEIV